MERSIKLSAGPGKMFGNVEIRKPRQHFSRSGAVSKLTSQKRKNEDYPEDEKRSKVSKSSSLSSNGSRKHVTLSKAKELLISRGILVKHFQEDQNNHTRETNKSSTEHFDLVSTQNLLESRGIVLKKQEKKTEEPLNVKKTASGKEIKTEGFSLKSIMEKMKRPKSIQTSTNRVGVQSRTLNQNTKKKNNKSSESKIVPGKKILGDHTKIVNNLKSRGIIVMSSEVKVPKVEQTISPQKQLIPPKVPKLEKKTPFKAPKMKMIPSKRPKLEKITPSNDNVKKKYKQITSNGLSTGRPESNIGEGKIMLQKLQPENR